MSRHDRIPSQLRHLSPPTTDDEIADHRWARLWRTGIAEIDVERVECEILRQSIITECRRQNGAVKAENLPAGRDGTAKPYDGGAKMTNRLYGQKNGHSVEIKKEASK